MLTVSCHPTRMTLMGARLARESVVAVAQVYRVIVFRGQASLPQKIRLIQIALFDHRSLSCLN
jgi:hypothetical protein